MSGRFRPGGEARPCALRWRSDPPPEVRASVYYADALVGLPKTTAAVLSLNVLRLIRQELGTYEAAATWLAAVVKRRGAPVGVHIGDRTLMLGPGSDEQLLGHIGVMHAALEAQFGRIERVHRPDSAA